MIKILTNKETICYEATLHRCLHIKPSAVLSGAEPEAEREHNSWLEKSQAKGLCVSSPHCGKGGLLNRFQPLFNPDNNTQLDRDLSSFIPSSSVGTKLQPPWNGPFSSLPSLLFPPRLLANHSRPHLLSQPLSLAFTFMYMEQCFMEFFTYPRPSFCSLAHTTLPFAPVEIKDTDGVCPKNCPKAVFFSWWIHYFYSLQNNYLHPQISITSILLSHLADDFVYNTKGTEDIWYFLTHEVPTYSIFPLVSRDKTFVF